MTATAEPGVHRAAVTAVELAFAELPADAPVRLRKRTSNLFRFRDGAGGLTVDGLDRVLAVDPVARTAEVQGMTTYEDLVAATLTHGLMPLVVPQLKTITLGGAVVGLGIESTSFRDGLPHESVLAADVLTGTGEIVRTGPDENPDLLAGLPNSYGTLGYALRLTIELAPVKPFVRLRHVPFRSSADAAAALTDITATRAWHGEDVDFLDGVVFGREEHVLTLGRMVDEAPSLSDYTGQRIYYRSLQELPRRPDGHGGQVAVDHLTIHDYLWRWDTDWFWCSGALGVQNPVVRRLWPSRWRRSDVYRRLVALDRRTGLSQAIARAGGAAGVEPVIQDVEVPVDRPAGVPRLLPRRDRHPPGLALPPAAARHPALAALRPRPRRHLRQRRVLVRGRSRARPGARPPQPPHRGGPHGLRRPQVAVLDVELHA